MASTVLNSAVLKKRVKRFFDSPSAAELSKFIAELSMLGEVILFGGFLRDVALFTARGFSSDLDIVVDCDKRMLHSFFNTRSASLNKFDGYRLEVGSWEVDVWPLKETWAFKSGLVNYNGRESLLKTTITNWDAIAYSFLDEKVIVDEDYISRIYNGELDLVLFENPSRIGALLRVLRAIHDKRAKILMPKLLRYLKSELEVYSAEEIFQEQLRLFNKAYFNTSEIKSFQEEVKSLREDLFGTKIAIRGQNFKFCF